jgi:hypothetical protein
LLLLPVSSLIDDHHDAAGFLAFALWVALVYIGLTALEGHRYTIVRFFIIMGAVGIVYVGKQIIDVLGKPP